MNHVDEGIVVALRDGLPVEADHRLHLEACVPCTDALASARERATRIRGTLETLDPERATIDVEAAKRRVRARMDVRRAAEPPRNAGRWHLGKAAALLLLATGAASALPGSPVRGWLGVGEETPAATSGDPDDAVQETAATGIDVPVTDAGIRIVLESVVPGARVELIWIDETVARVSAPEGTGYALADGAMTVSVAPGPVSVALPRSARPVSVMVNGRIVMERDGEQLLVSGDIVERSPDRIVFQAVGR